MKNALILLSGGLDSACTAYYVKKKLKYKNLHLLYVNYNHRAHQQELFCAQKIATSLRGKLHHINMDWLGDLSGSYINKKGRFPKTKIKDLKSVKKGKQELINWWVPTRNTLFLTAGLAFAESAYLQKKIQYDIFIGFKNEGRIPMKDATQKFLNEMNKLTKHSTLRGTYKFKAPLLPYDKTDVVEIGEQLHVPWQYTYSCYTGAGFTTRNNKKIPVHCGFCLNCRLRQKGFYWADIPDTSIYK